MKRVQLSKLPFAELNARRESIENNPKNRLPKGSFNLYTVEARRKLDDIAWAVTYQIKATKEAESEAKSRGFYLYRGCMEGTGNDVAGTWYWGEYGETLCLDGKGYSSKREALDELERFLVMEELYESEGKT